jgi:hypothetical protein
MFVIICYRFKSYFLAPPPVDPELVDGGLLDPELADGGLLDLLPPDKFPVVLGHPPAFPCPLACLCTLDAYRTFSPTLIHRRRPQ